MSVKNRVAKDRIINALGDLYRMDRHSTGLTGAQNNAVKASITALEAEYLQLLGVDKDTSYAKVTTAFKNAKSDLDKIVQEREDLANAYLSVSKILGSFTQLLKLF